SPTDDVEGQIALVPQAGEPSADEIAWQMKAFVGRILQRPPVFAAVHVQGRRAYELARRGVSVELEPRPVEVYSLSIRSYCYPELVLDVECGSGFYVRSLGRDLAESLGTSAVMSGLVRTAVGGFTLPRAADLERLTAENLADHLSSALEALTMLSTIRLESGECESVRQGRTIRRTTPSAESEWCAVDPAGDLVAILKRRDDGSLGPVGTFPPRQANR